MPGSTPISSQVLWSHPNRLGPVVAYFVLSSVLVSYLYFVVSEGQVVLVASHLQDLKQRPRERASSAGCYLVVVRNGTAKSLHNLYGNDKWGRVSGLPAAGSLADLTQYLSVSFGAVTAHVGMHQPYIKRVQVRSPHSAPSDPPHQARTCAYESHPHLPGLTHGGMMYTALA
jgi:hypothetical protein